MVAVMLRAEARYGADKGQEHAWKDIAPAYHGIPQELVKVYVRTFQSTAAGLDRAQGACALALLCGHRLLDSVLRRT